MSSFPISIKRRLLSPAALFACTLLLSASLMFVLQPLFGKLLLPLLGGSPAVWNTCMVFYQSLLFMGYLYAHQLTTRLNNQRQLQIHSTLLILGLIALPVGLSSNLTPPSEGNPSLWLIWTLLKAIGLPYLVISTTAPLLQSWFARCGQTTSDDPYYLYAASNTGSLLALLSYPFLIEPGIGLANQQMLWSAAYAVLTVFILLCGWQMWRHTDNAEPSQETSEQDPLTIKQQLHWLILAFVPSSLLLGLTQFISTDIAAVPLLWILPLTLYLLSFILVFSRWSLTLNPLMIRLQPAVLVVFLAYSFINPAVLPYWLDLSFHGLAFFLAIMVCHGELAQQRPSTAHLTRYYLLMSLGGMLGGLFNTFVAPFVFNAVYEYPIMIVASLLLRPGLNYRQDWRSLIFPGLILLSGLILFIAVDDLPDYLDIIGGALILLAGISYSLRRSTAGLAALTAVILFFSISLHDLLSNTLYQERSFFGVLSVRETYIADEQHHPEKVHELYHGTTKHGAERLSSQTLTTPLTYYSRPGPIGQLFAEFDGENQHWRIGAVGLGAGALACYTKPEQDWRFYEIDPLVVQTAQNTKWFNYLSRCNPQAQMVVGDARLSLQREADQSFDLLIMDAFSSDAVPTHLLTREALSLYLSKLKDDGLLAFHITNRHLALKTILADHEKQLRIHGLLQEFNPENPPPLVVATDWVVFAKTPERLQRLNNSRLGHWQKLPLVLDLQPWTDDYTSIIGIWK